MIIIIAYQDMTTFEKKTSNWTNQPVTFAITKIR